MKRMDYLRAGAHMMVDLVGFGWGSGESEQLL